jgi:prepilin-type N-terminal cleavage/methylation domain-containing protein
MFNLKLITKNLKQPFGERGYTMIEMVVALAILGSTIFTVLVVFKTINRSMWQVEEKSQLEKTLVFTMEQMVQEVRQAVSITALGPYVPSANVTFINSDSVTTIYNAGTTYNIMPLTNIHLQADSNTKCVFKIPNMTEPLKRENDATLVYFLKKMPDKSVKLYQRMVYYNGAYTEAFPAMASTDQYRLGNPRATPIREPGPGTPTPTPSAASTPTPVYKDDLGRDPGLYRASNLNFDDVCFFYDNDNCILAISLTASLKSKSLHWSGLQRRTKTLTSSVALRRSQ